MDRYAIRCTEEQTKKALELGAPIELESEYYNPTKNDFKLESPIACSSFTNGYHYAKCPTAEEMIGWLEEQGLCIDSEGSCVFVYPNEEPMILEPFVTKVLVRNSKNYRWIAGIFVNKSIYNGVPCVNIAGSANDYSEWIPYQGNEHLAYTSNDVRIE